MQCHPPSFSPSMQFQSLTRHLSLWQSLILMRSLEAKARNVAYRYRRGITTHALCGDMFTVGSAMPVVLILPHEISTAAHFLDSSDCMLTWKECKLLSFCLRKCFLNLTLFMKPNNWVELSFRVGDTPYVAIILRDLGQITELYRKLKTKLHGLSLRANYTDRATAACRRSDCQLLYLYLTEKKCGYLNHWITNSSRC
jgi:hypothetical protein